MVNRFHAWTPSGLSGQAEKPGRGEETMPAENKTVKLAAVADIHCNRNNREALGALFSHITTVSDVLLLCGDLADYGLIEEAHILADVLKSTVRIPMVGVLGNHDYENGNQNEIRQILSDVGMALLDGEIKEIHGIGFAGVKGFCGGFGRHQLEAWGERIIKRFVQEAKEEACKLELALARLGEMPRIALLHYSPIRATVEGEIPEVLPFLGSSRLEEPINWFEVTAVFHGHAHSGSPEGHTMLNIPVYNVALSALRKAFPDRPPFRLLEIPRPGT
jgi:Icc-related predicted phosphoesterase